MNEENIMRTDAICIDSDVISMKETERILETGDLLGFRRLSATTKKTPSKTELANLAAALNIDLGIAATKSDTKWVMSQSSFADMHTGSLVDVLDLESVREPRPQPVPTFGTTDLWSRRHFWHDPLVLVTSWTGDKSTYTKVRTALLQALSIKAFEADKHDNKTHFRKIAQNWARLNENIPVERAEEELRRTLDADRQNALVRVDVKELKPEQVTSRSLSEMEKELRRFAQGGR